MTLFRQMKIQDGVDENLLAEVTTDNALKTVSPGLVDTKNISTIPLAASATFVGEWTDITDYSTVITTVESDQDSAVDGLCIEFSPDGITPYTNPDCYSILANTTKTFTSQPVGTHVRLSYTNGSVAQTSLTLLNQLKATSVKSSSHRLKDDLVADDDAELQKAVLMTEGSSDAVYKNLSSQYPLPCDGDSIYVKDIDIENSDNGGFTGLVTDYFDSLKTVNSDISSTNPKVITVRFKRSIQTQSIGFGCDDALQDFSNIKIEVLGSADEIRSISDESTDNTKYNSRVIDFAPEVANGIRITFATADHVGLSNLIIYKSQNRISRIQAIRPDGVVTDIGATNNDNLRVSVQEYGDTPSVDAFARLRISEPYTLFDSKQLHDKQPLFWDEATYAVEPGSVATSTHSTTNAATSMTVSFPGSYVARQTKQRFNYQPGKGQLCFMTFRAAESTGFRSRIGMFDASSGIVITPQNGIFFQVNDELSWNIAKNGSAAESVSQDNWNVDPLDGTGKSGITLDMDATHILIIDYEWLGVGRVRVGFVIDGLIYYCHYFNHANDSTFESVYMSTPNLPLRYDITPTAVNPGVNGTLDHICSTVVSEGGIEKTGVLRCIDTEDVHVNANSSGTIYACCAVRLKSTYLDVTVLPESMSMACATNDRFRWSLHLNPTLSTALTYTDLDNSSLQVATGATANTITDDGIKIASGYASTESREADETLNTALRIGSTISGSRDELVLAVMPLSSNADIYASLNVRELL